MTLTPTYAFPRYTAKVQANCRYGPGTAYLYAYGLFPGNSGKVWGRTASGSWLWVEPDGINYSCWVAASVIDVVGDVTALRVTSVRLPHSTLYGPPPWVKAERKGDEVTITWGKVSMTEDDDRGYLIEANVCQDGNLVWVAVQTYDTTYTLTDEKTCSERSSGLLYTVEKHGYTDPVKIPWPK
jgi:hypothetical protein